MNRQDYIVVTALFFLMIFIWLRDMTWLSTADDTLPILVSLLLFIWLGTPWKLFDDPPPLSKTKISVATALMILGIALNVTFLLAAGWTYLLWIWLQGKSKKERLPAIQKLLLLPLMSFPWIAIDAAQLGWWFRLSGAWVTAKVFIAAGYDVLQKGVNLIIDQLPISVEVACAGLNTLQSMLIAGTVANFIILGNSRRYWWNIPVLFALSWVANTLRIIVLCLVALWMGADFAVGVFHTWGGLLILVIMFALSWLILSLQEPKKVEE